MATAGLAVSLIPLSALSERFGRTPVMTAAVFSAALIGLAVPFSPNLAVLVVLRTLQGVALAGLPATAMAYLGEEVSKKAVASAIGLYVAGNSVGGMCSRVIAGFVAQAAGWRVALGVLGLLSLCCAVVFVLLSPRARNFEPARVSPRMLARTVGGHLGNPLLVRLYLLGLLFMAVFGTVYTVLGLPADRGALPSAGGGHRVAVPGLPGRHGDVRRVGAAGGAARAAWGAVRGHRRGDCGSAAESGRRRWRQCWAGWS